MSLTDTFASTAAVTIPVLMLAGAVELRSLADSVTKQIAGRERRSYMRIFRLIGKLAEFDKLEEQKIRPRQIFRLLKLFFDIMGALLPLSPGIPLSLSLVWLLAIAISGASETLCFLHLAGVNVPSDITLTLSIIAVVALIVLLILTPTAGTLITAPRVGWRQFAESLSGSETEIIMRHRGDKEFLEALRDVIPAGVETDIFDAKEAKKMTYMIQSLLSKDAPTKINDNDRQWRWRPHTQTGLGASSHRLPRSAPRRQTGRNRSLHKD